MTYTDIIIIILNKNNLYLEQSLGYHVAAHYVVQKTCTLQQSKRCELKHLYVKEMYKVTKKESRALNKALTFYDLFSPPLISQHNMKIHVLFCFYFTLVLLTDRDNQSTSTRDNS